MNPYHDMLKWFGALICKMRKRHLWQKAFDGHVGEGIPARIKQCKRCGIMRTVKRRAAK